MPFNLQYSLGKKSFKLYVQYLHDNDYNSHRNTNN